MYERSGYTEYGARRELHVDVHKRTGIDSIRLQRFYCRSRLRFCACGAREELFCAKSVLRMELDIQKFMQNSDQHQFEFQQLQSSYLRRIAHHVAQHYGLQTFSSDNAIDGSGTVGSKVIARKTPESKFPAVCLSAIPAKQTENKITDQVKITIRQRPSKSLTDRTELENRRSPVRTVEDRKEEYEKARARIFNGSCSTDVEGPFSITSADGRSFWSGRDELECYIRTADENEKAQDVTSRVAIFRDQEKDRWDPDYDRSYNRYVRNLTPSQNLGLNPCNALQPPFVQYDTCSQVGQLWRNQTPISYRPSHPVMTPLCAFGCSQISPKDVVYRMQWPSPALVYAQSYGHFRPAIFHAPAYQQSLIFDHSQNC